MHIGYCIENFDKHLSATNLIQTTEILENSKIDSIWTTDHILQKKGSRLPIYDRITESISTLMFLAGKTQRLRLGISTLVLPIRNPILVAKQLATLDYLSDGRLIPSFSVGWNNEEYNVLNSNFRDRGKRMDTYLRIIKELWNGKVKQTGEFEFDNVSFEPTHQNLSDKIFMIAGNSPPAIKRAIKYGGWHPAGGISGNEIRSLLSDFDLSDDLIIYVRKSIVNENIGEVLDEYKDHDVNGVIFDLSRNDNRNSKLDELLSVI